ncbi:MAG TPA: DUF296 domain-containing protein [Candidatus Saccharimonadales bacterium]|nr:DUF296 domain-containing protein [Candidatus Saccharimonadales bacterium]
MIYTTDNFNYIIRLQKGETWSQGFADFASQTGVKGAWLNMIGSATEVTLGAYNLEQKQYLWKTFTGTLEIVAVQGNISLDESGKPMSHLHGTIANEHYQTFGGHIKDFTVGATLEVFVHCLDGHMALRRTLDQNTGLQLLDLPKGQ